MNINSIKSQILSMDNSQLKEIAETIKYRRSALGQLMKNSFDVGDKVYFEHKGKKVYGKVTGIMKKNIKVEELDDKWRVWNVHPTFLQKGGK